MESTGTYPSSYINTVKGGATAPLAPLFLRPWPMQDTLRLEVELATTGIEATSRMSTITDPKSESGSGGGINLNAIISARRRLKPTDLGKIIGETATTSEEVACLVRSGARAETSSLTGDAASFLKQRFQHIKEVTAMSDSESDVDESEWN